MLANDVSWFLVPLAVLGLRVEMTCSFLAHLPAVAVPLCSFLQSLFVYGPGKDIILLTVRCLS